LSHCAQPEKDTLKMFFLVVKDICAQGGTFGKQKEENVNYL
jgi:hypothetical protein